MLSPIGKKVLYFDDNLNFHIINPEKIYTLENHEKYICNCLINKTKIDKTEFKNIVIKDALAKNLIIAKKQNNYKFLIFFFSMLAIMLAWTFFHNFSLYTPIAIILAIITFLGTPIFMMIDKNTEKNNYKNTPQEKKNVKS